MQRMFVNENRLLDTPIGLIPRILLIGAVVMLVVSYVTPLWTMTMYAPQYPDGLRLFIHSYKLDGGGNGTDVKEINILNHYIGMREIVTSDFTEFKWMPFVIGTIALLVLRTAAIGRMMQVIDVTVLYTYFGLFALWSFGYKLYSYGHTLQTGAAVKVPPFTPPIFGFKQIANFEVYSYPGVGGYMLAGTAVVLFVALVIAWRQRRAWTAEEATRVA